MKPNILILIIDSLRADRFFGQGRTCKTPNIDSLIKRGMYFQNAISSSDVTGICVGNVFTGKYSFKTGITLRNFNSKNNTLFDILKNNGYSIHGTIPNLTWFNYLTKNFDDKDLFFATNKTQDDLSKNVGSLILKRLDSKLTNEPWVYYIHLEDLHQNIVVPKDFDNEKYGNTKYDRMVSNVDYWIGKILEKINLRNTLLIITSDHGDYIPIVEDYIGNIPNIQAVMRKGKKHFPSIEPIGLKFFIIIRDFVKYFQKKKIQKQLTRDEMRTLNARGDKTLYDETQKIPILFVGHHIKSIISKELVGGIDIMPTILNMVDIKYNDPNLDGNNLTAISNGGTFKERPLYIESGDTQERKVGFLIGIRTPEFKYLRSREDSKLNVSLFDLVNDPLEDNNIANEQPSIVKNMERILNQLTNQSNIKQESDISKEDETKIAEELKRMGYM